jgi:hypothetical protein
MLQAARNIITQKLLTLQQNVLGSRATPLII